MHGSSRAHGARLNCNKQFAAAEPVITEVSSRFAQRHDFGMGGRIGIGEIAIPSSPKDAPFADNHCSHGHLVGVEGSLGATQGLLHPKFVGGSGISYQLSVLGYQLSVLGSQFSDPDYESHLYHALPAVERAVRVGAVRPC
jgi:hypothetical protein